MVFRSRSPFLLTGKVFLLSRFVDTHYLPEWSRSVTGYLNKPCTEPYILEVVGSASILSRNLCQAFTAIKTRSVDRTFVYDEEE